MDGGAYVTLSPVVLSRGTLHATGPYDCPNVRIRSRVVMTNTPPNGAFRGFGAPQTLFAAEMQIERLAEKLGMDPLAIRRRNAIRAGSTLPMGQTLRESVGARQALEACVEAERLRAARARVRALEPQPQAAQLARDRPRPRPPRRGLHGQRRAVPQQPRGRHAHARRRAARAVGLDRVRPGHDDALRPDRRRDARRPARARHGRDARHRARPEQRPDGREPHLHDGRAPAARGGARAQGRGAAARGASPPRGPRCGRPRAGSAATSPRGASRPSTASPTG